MLLRVVAFQRKRVANLRACQLVGRFQILKVQTLASEQVGTGNCWRCQFKRKQFRRLKRSHRTSRRTRSEIDPRVLAVQQDGPAECLGNRKVGTPIVINIT